MQKIFRISLFLSFILVFNITTLYTSVTHNHQFSWVEDESCSAYLISVSQNSDTFSFTVNHPNITSNEKVLDFQKSDLFLNFEYKNILSTRAPPAIN